MIDAPLFVMQPNWLIKVLNYFIQVPSMTDTLWNIKKKLH
jgi:hypothetical protein